MNIRKSSPAKVLVTSTIGLAFGLSALVINSFGTFVFPLSETFGWDRGEVSLAVTFFIIASIVMSPIAGWLIDRFGVRKILIPSIVLFGLALASMSLMSGSIWQLYLGYVLLAVVGVGVSTANYARLIVAWFTDKRGLALGIALAGTGIGVALAPFLVQSVTSIASWRMAYVALGVLAVVAVLPCALLWARYPENQGAELAATATGEMKDAELNGYHFRDAIRSKAFILLMISFTLLGVEHGSMSSSLVPLLLDRGLPAMDAAIMASALGFSLIGGRVVIGYLLDRVFAPLLMIAVISIATVGLAMMLAGVTGPWLIVSICCLGFIIGADLDFMTYMISRYIGLRAFTLVFGIVVAAFQVGMSMGPMLMGYSARATGGYDLALWLLLGTTSLAMLPFLFLGRYPRDFQVRHSTREASGEPVGAHP